MGLSRKVDKFLIGLGLLAMLSTGTVAHYYVHKETSLVQDGKTQMIDLEKNVDDAIYCFLAASAFTLGASYRARRHQHTYTL